MPKLTQATKAKYDAMLQPHETYELIGDNPTMKMNVADTGHAAQMQVLHKGHGRATMEWYQATGEFLFALANAAGVTKTEFELKLDGKAYIGGKEIATMEAVAHARTTVEHNIADHAKPTIVECKAAFKLLPHFDWKKDDDFYIKDSTGGKIVLIKYRATPAATEAAPGNFFYEVLTAAK